MIAGAAVTAVSELKPWEVKQRIRHFLSVLDGIKNGYRVENPDAFLNQINRFLHSLTPDLLGPHWPRDASSLIQYALCAYVDECLLEAGRGDVRSRVLAQPFQARYFGDHLAGQGFFNRLTLLRTDVPANTAVLDIYLLCLTQGFRGQLVTECADRLHDVIRDVQHDIARYRPPRLQFSSSLPSPVRAVRRWPRLLSATSVTVLSLALLLGGWFALSDALHRQSLAIIDRLDQRIAK